MDLIRYNAACKALAEARAVDEVVLIRDKASAVAAAARIAKNHDLEIDAAEIRIRAERRLGEMINEQARTVGLNKGAKAGRLPKNGGTRKEPPLKDNRPTLASVGIDKKLSARSRQIASIPKTEFEQTLNEHREAQQAVTSSTMQKLLKKKTVADALHSRSEDKARKTARLRSSLYDVRRGDFKKVLSDVNNVSLILTDPPYPKKDLHLWRELGLWASQALHEDGMLVAYSGQMYLPEVLSMLCESLSYWWCGAVVHKGSGNLTPLGFPVRKVINQWKPLVMFCKRGGNGYANTFRDLIHGVGPQKTDHNWQQPVEEAKILIESFSVKGDLVVDPFAGSGGFCKAAHELGRIAIGAEILSDE